MTILEPGVIVYRRLSALCVLAAMSAHGADGAAARVLMRADLLQRVVGNTIHFQGGNEHIFEYLDPAGEIRAESTAHGRFTARWRLLDDQTMCFESADPMSSGCVGVELEGTRITFVRRDGVIEGPFDLLPGNPRRL